MAPEAGDGLDEAGFELQFETPQSLLKHPPQAADWIVEGLLAKATKLLLAGYPKAGKSTFLFFLLSALARGESVLELDIQRSTWLMLSEEGPRTIHQKLFSFGINTADCDILLHRSAIGVPWETIVERSVERCIERGHHLLLVDTISSWANLQGEDENRPGPVRDAIRPLERAVANGIAVIIVHHTRKGGGNFGEAIRGTGHFSAIVDTPAELRRVGGQSDEDEDSRIRLLINLSRDYEVFDKLGIRLDESRSTYTRVSPEELKEQRQDRGAGGARDMLLDGLGDHPMTAQQAADYMGLTEHTASRHLRNLLRQGRVTRIGAGNGQSPFVYHRVEDVE
jgi:AAA domain